MIANSTMAGYYDPTFVVTSFLIALLSAYAALDLAGRVACSRSFRGRFAWLCGGATAMGVGIWSMHYIGMLALRMPMPVLYDWPTVLASMVAAVLASGIALFLSTRSRMGVPATIAGSLAMGGGIAAMHYIGMDAMRMPAKVTYSEPLVALSIVLAIVIAAVALRITFAIRLGSAGWSWRKGLSALLMGMAIPAMHYTGMAAARWRHAELSAADLRHAISISDLGTSCIAFVAVVILCLVFLAVVIDRRFSGHTSEIQGSEERYRRIISSAFDAFLGLADDGTIVDWNTQATVTFGWTAEEACGRPVLEMFSMGSEEGASGAEPLNLKLLLRDGRTELEARHKTGLVFPVEVAVSAIQIGERNLFAAFVHDVTERKLAEQQMHEARASAEASNRAKSEFLANMSHEIRTPLNGVIGMTDLALETELTREQRDYIETVKVSADSLLGVINDILDFSKIEAGRVDLEEIDFNLREMLESTLKTLALRADEKGLELVCEVAPDIPEMLKGDPSRLRQILTNLVGNAVKFTDEGEVSVLVSAAGSEGASMLHFAVCDTGIGIGPEKIERIFESFSQADTSTTRQYGGTGLGLTISRRLIELMGGRIWVESEPGRGSRFHFEIPLHEAERSATAPNEPVHHALVGTKVLIIDDNKTNRRILEGLLTRWGMHVASAADGETALRMLGEAIACNAPYRLILTDMHMPKMDGFMVVEELKRDPGFSAATVMMLSSGGRRGDTDKCQELGIAAYLLKPVRQTELQTAIARALGANPIEEEGMITQQTLRAERPQNEFLNILLAEDNEVNQKLAVRLLEKRGHTVTVVGNGRQAVQAARSKRFDLVLMDVQMPEMDGIEATAAIREQEKVNGRRQPIVAMTALVMKGDRERCLDAKMDGYLSKPVRPQELDEVLETFSKQKRAGLQNDTAKAPAVGTPVDFAELTARVEGDLSFVGELLEVLREDCPRKLRAIREAKASGDLSAVKRIAHGLKGALGNVSANRAASLAAQIEHLEEANGLLKVPGMVEELEVECDVAIEALSAVYEESVR
jgi:two-component system sensor histidine kinase/response regulator